MPTCPGHLRDCTDGGADMIGLRWRLMILLGAFASMRPEELAELRRKDVDLELRQVAEASPSAGTVLRGILGDPVPA
ncbi:site-specific integrase [Streptomyces sp. P9-2B-2]|uniref:site-specific integrase n=1 Tax=unclassified Streptomyces TaxID=2593676 RepID=UPI001B3C6B4E|nr:MULTISPECIES: site-specific integrase [Streptomyces]MCX4639229.1 site-specific integrase [Streptomyces platensis]WJY43145.1 site-specific integrase [Streptomyces sp. P9-2B-2]